MKDFILFSTQMLKQVQHDKKYLSISMQVQHDKKYLSILMQVQYDYKYLSILMQVQYDGKHLAWQFTIPDYLEPFHLLYQGQYVIENNKIAIIGTYENNPVLITGTFTDATTLIDVNSNSRLFF